MKKLRIAQIAPLWFSIPPQKYGGTERVISSLAEGLVKRGHDVTLFASGDSKTSAKLVSVVKKGLIGQGIPWHDSNWNLLNNSTAFEMAEDFDIIHSHWSMAMFFKKFTSKPLLQTFHNAAPGTDHRWQVWKRYRNGLGAIFVSKNQKENMPFGFKKNWLIYNGINVGSYEFNPRGKDTFIWIGRICPAKGIENAVAIAEKTGIELLIAGQIQPMHKGYFKDSIKPHLSNKIRYVGELSQKELPQFYGNARAFLYPLEWNEPFGLAMVEAMACGTPVIAFNKGSVKEVVTHGKTGFVVNNVSQMIKAINRLDSISRRACRDWIESNFTDSIMVANYEKAYLEMVKTP